MLKRAVPAIVAAIALGSSLGACADPVDRVAEAEATIAGVLSARLGLATADVGVDCPDDDELLPGSELTCAVSVEQAEPVEVPFVLGTAEGDPARLERAVIPTTDAESYLATELATPAEGPVTVDCGMAPILVRDVGETFPCDAVRTSDGVGFAVTVTVFGLDGTVRHHVDPTTTTTLAPPPTVPPPPG